MSVVASRWVYVVRVLTIIIAFLVPSSAFGVPRFIGLDPGDSFSHRVSGDGSTIVGRAGLDAVTWINGAPAVTIAPLPGASSEGMGFDSSFSGDIVVGFFESAQGQEGFRWSATAGSISLGHLHGPTSNTVATGTTADGSMIVGFDCAASGLCEAFAWTAATGIVGRGDLPGGRAYSTFTAVSADGSVAVGVSESSIGQEASRWTSEGGMQGLGIVGGANDVSDDGSTIVGIDLETGETFVWQESGVFRLPKSLGEGLYSGVGISADGKKIVGQYTPSASPQRAFIWSEEEGTRDLADVLSGLGLGAELAGWSLTSANSVSNNGTVIAGHGRNPSGMVQAFVAEIPDLTPRQCASIGERPRSTSVLASFQNNSCEDWASVSQPGSNLRGAVLSRADLTASNLSGTDLADADLTGADLSGSFLIGAKLDGAVVDSAALTDSYYNQSTRFPSGGFWNQPPWGLDGGIEPWNARMIPLPEPSSTAGVGMIALGLVLLDSIRSRGRYSSDSCVRAPGRVMS